MCRGSRGQVSPRRSLRRPASLASCLEPMAESTRRPEPAFHEQVSRRHTGSMYNWIFRPALTDRTGIREPSAGESPLPRQDPGRVVGRASSSIGESARRAGRFGASSSGIGDSGLGLRRCLVLFGHLATKCFACLPIPLCCLNALDTTHPLAALGHYLAHFFNGMVDSAVVTVGSLGHRG